MIAVPAKGDSAPARTSMHVYTYMWLTRSSAGGTSLSPGVGHARLVHFSILSNLFSLSFSLCLSWFISLPPSFYTKPSSLPAGHRIPICSPCPPPDVSLILSLKSLLLPTFTACPGPSSPSYHAYVAGLLRGFKRPDTLVYWWYHRSWLQPLSFYPSPTGGEDNIGLLHGLFSFLLPRLAST